MNTQFVIKILSLLTLISNISIVLFVACLFVRKTKFVRIYWKRFVGIVAPNSVKLSFIVSVTATLGSLYLSEIAKFEPCKLCWFQRIFMYPLVFVLGMATKKKAKDVWQYVLPLAIIGTLIAVYHYYLQITPQELVPCSTTGISVSCTDRQFTHFGYITIPFMSLSAFTLITIGMIFGRENANRKQKSKKTS